MEVHRVNRRNTRISFLASITVILLSICIPHIASAGWGGGGGGGGGAGEPPEDPSYLTVPSTDADGTYSVSWGTALNATSYELQEKIGTGGWSTVYSGTSRTATFSKSVVEDYSYRVRGCNSNGCGGYYGWGSHTVNVTGGITSPTSEGVADAVGTTPYSVEVAGNGDSIIAVPLQLIPGVAGFSPSLTLEYDSGRGTDLLALSKPEETIGYGWSLIGASQIRRCVVNKTSTTNINLNSGDSLCLDGMPLVLASGTHLSYGAIYRTQIESYAKIEIKGGGSNLWFEAKLPSGATQEYGRTAGSRVDHNGGTDFQWSLNKETDAHGNVIDYTYWHDPSNGINRIAKIEYAGATVEFEYRDRSDTSAVSIGSSSQTQAAFLHKILVKYSGTSVREYRLLDEVVSSRRRLNKIQQCGYDEVGSAISCMAALDFNWVTPSATITGVPILVDALVDGISAVHEIEYGTILKGGTHSFVLSGSDTPFGTGSLPSNTQLLTGSTNDPLRHVATKLRRDNGLGGFHDTSYAYQNVGIESTKNWGFLGFYSQRVTDSESGIVTYVQYRLDYPYFGQTARTYQFDANYGSHSETLTRSEWDYGQQSISHGSSSSVYPYATNTIDFIYEGSTQIGASQTETVLTFVGGYVDKTTSTTETATGVSEGTSGSTWGDIAPFTLTSIKRTEEFTVEFNNRTTSGKWLIGFTEVVKKESWAGPAVGAGIIQDAEMTPHSTSLKTIEVKQFPTHASLTLESDFTYDSAGRLIETDVIGDNVAARSTTTDLYSESRYLGRRINPKGHTTTLSSYDLRFGTVKIKGDPNGRNTEWTRDAFGRITNVENADGVVSANTYSNCPSGCGVSAYGISPSYKIETTTTRASTTIAPIERAYYDNLGRVIRVETQSFDGSSYSKVDTKYDELGRIEKSSLPYFSGIPEDIVPTYDIRGRTTNISRPDGGSTAIVYSASGSTVVVTSTDQIKKSDGTTNDGTFVKRNEYDVLGQLIKSTDGYGTSVDPYTTFTYDSNGKTLSTVVNGGAAGTTTSTFEYDEAGNRTKLIGPNVGTITSTYTALGELRTTTDNKNQTSTYTYDTLGRRTARVNADGTSNWVWDTATNGVGKLKSRKLGTAFEETYSYNSDAKLSSVATKIVQIGESASTTYTTSHTYDVHGRPSTTTYPGAGFVLSRAYNARGYLAELKDGSTALQTIVDRDAFGNSIEEDYGNGVSTERTYDPESGRLVATNTEKGATVFQDNDFAWRSNGKLESRIANPANGLATTRKETFEYDVLSRLTLAETFINSSNTRDLVYAYNDLGNITSKTSTLPGDIDVTSYAYGAGAAGPHAVTSANIGGVLNTLTYDANGGVTKYDIVGTSDDKYIEYNVSNQPTKIVVGNSLTDTTPIAKDEFAYGPDGHRYARKSTWQEGGSTITEKVVYVGKVEIILDDEHSHIDKVTKTMISPNVMHVEVEGTTTSEFFEYAHHDHLGSIEVITDGSGNALDRLAYEAFGSRKKSDWTANISATELDSRLDLSTSHSRKVRGFTGHEHLDRTGFIHMNGRVYDPVLARFLSPDPVVMSSSSSQSWNRYAYVMNSPASYTDPTGFECEGDGCDGDPIDEITRRGRAFDPLVYSRHEATLIVEWRAASDGRLIARTVNGAREGDHTPGGSGTIDEGGASAGGLSLGTQLFEEIVVTAAQFSDGRRTIAGLLPALPRSWTNFGVGAGNSMSWGLGAKISDWLNGEGSFDRESDAYEYGGIFGMFTSIGAAIKGGVIKFFWDPRSFSTISRQYWSARGGANGHSLHHVFFAQSNKWVPEGIKNAGFNLLDLPAFTGIFHRSLGLNQWMGFAKNWGKVHRIKAIAVENLIRLGIPGSVFGAGVIGEEVGSN